jgi:hypothetical protein
LSWDEHPRVGVGEGSATVVWFNAPGFRVIDIYDSDIDVGPSPVEASRCAGAPTVSGCPVCGVIARSKDRRWVTVRDAPAANRPVTVRWRKLGDGSCRCDRGDTGIVGPELGVMWSTV